MADPARFGLDVGIFGTLATAELVLEQARFAETAGFDSVWVADHVAFPTKFESKYPYNATGRFPAALDAPLLEPIATMGVLVGATTRIRIGTAALIMAYRNPVLMARMLVTLDQFSGGRIVLGAGVGWLAEEFDVLGAPPFNRRGRVTDEYLAIFKKLCAGGEVSHDGASFSFDPVFSVPGSVLRPHPPPHRIPPAVKRPTVASRPAFVRLRTTPTASPPRPARSSTGSTRSRPSATAAKRRRRARRATSDSSKSIFWPRDSASRSCARPKR